MMGASTISLGLVASGKRSIKNGSQYDALIDTSVVKGNEVELMSDGTVYDTLRQMEKIVRSTLGQTKRLAKHLEGKTREQTCRNIFNFLYHHVQYKKDNPLREQLRTPSRSWNDRTNGVDCDCYSIFISSILTNLSIPHAFRMAGYQGDFQHVYVVVPKQGNKIAGPGSYYTIDPVVNRFNYETPFNKKHDQMRVTMLNGADDSNCKRPEPLRRYVYTAEVVQSGLVPTKQYLKSKNIPFAETVNDSGETILLINTTAGAKELPSIITKSAADQVSAVLPESGIQPVQPIAETTPTKTAQASMPDIPWWWLLIGGGALVLLSGNEKVSPGLDGVRAKRKAKKLKTVHI